MKTTHTVTLSVFDLITCLKEQLGIEVHVNDIDLKAKSTGVLVDISEIKLEWVKDTNPRVQR